MDSLTGNCFPERGAIATFTTADRTRSNIQALQGFLTQLYHCYSTNVVALFFSFLSSAFFGLAVAGAAA